MDILELNARSRDIFQRIVESYLDTGIPVGSRTLSRLPDMQLSPASIRNVMADLEDAGLLCSPHTSAGRMPTELGLRLFVDGLLEVGDLSREERTAIESQCATRDKGVEDVLAQASEMLSGLSQCASLVTAPKRSAPLKQVEFVQLAPGRGLAVLVFEDGTVENRVFKLAPATPSSALVRASNYLNAHLGGGTLEEACARARKDIDSHQSQLDELSAAVVSTGFASWSSEAEGGSAGNSVLIVRGRSNLLEDESALENLEQIRQLFDDLEDKRQLLNLLELVRDGEGVKIFIGAENSLFSLSGSSLIVSPYMDGANKIVGVVGIIGPKRLNYARIIPMVDYTAKVIGRIL